MEPREIRIKAILYGTIAAATIILHNLFIYIYPYIKL